MNQETKEVYNLLQDIFKNIWEQQKYSEVKNGVLLTLNIAIFAIISRTYFYIPKEISSTVCNKSIFYILILLFIYHIFLILQSFFPKDNNEEKNKVLPEKINIFFFGDIKKLGSREYLNLVINKIGKSDTIDKQFLLDLSNQIVILSEIAQKKYTSFKNNVIRMYGISFILVLYFTYIYCKN